MLDRPSARRSSNVLPSRRTIALTEIRCFTITFLATVCIVSFLQLFYDETNKMSPCGRHFLLLHLGRDDWT